jgi:hypothetical protein
MAKSEKKGTTYMREWISRPGNREKKRQANKRYYDKAKAEGKITKNNSERNRFRKHGITKEYFQEMVEQQGNCCAICEKPGTWETLVVDHDHACCDSQFSCGNCVRGGLCRTCNTVLGLLKEDESRIMSVLSYIKDTR